MKILKINNSKSWEICGCDPPIPTDGFGGEKGCPAFASVVSMEIFAKLKTGVAIHQIE